MNMVSKLTLFDTLCMMVPGYMILSLMNGAFVLNGTIPFFIFCYIIGLVYHRIVEGLLSCLRNMPCLIRKAKEQVDSEVNVKLPEPTPDEYYKAYYYLMEKNFLGNIPVLESQVAFCKDIFFILLVMTVAGAYRCFDYSGLCENTCNFVMIILISTLALLYIWYKSQMKIHYLVWQGYHYLKHQENEETDS